MIRYFLIEYIFDWMCRPILLWTFWDVIKIGIEVAVLSCLQYIFIYIYRYFRDKIKDGKTHKTRKTPKKKK